jgi:hypothetical protein
MRFAGPLGGFSSLDMETGASYRNGLHCTSEINTPPGGRHVNIDAGAAVC